MVSKRLVSLEKRKVGSVYKWQEEPNFHLILFATEDSRRGESAARVESVGGATLLAEGLFLGGGLKHRLEQVG